MCCWWAIRVKLLHFSKITSAYFHIRLFAKNVRWILFDLCRTEQISTTNDHKKDTQYGLKKCGRGWFLSRPNCRFKALHNTGCEIVFLGEGSERIMSVKCYIKVLVNHSSPVSDISQTSTELWGSDIAIKDDENVDFFFPLTYINNNNLVRTILIYLYTNALFLTDADNVLQLAIS